MLGGVLHLDISCPLLYFVVCNLRTILNRFRLRIRRREARDRAQAASPRATTDKRHLSRSKSCSSLPRITRRFRTKPKTIETDKETCTVKLRPASNARITHREQCQSQRPPTDIEREDVELDDDDDDEEEEELAMEFGGGEEGEDTPWSTASSLDASTLSTIACIPSLTSFPSTALCTLLPPTPATLTTSVCSDERAKQLLLINIKHKCIAEQLTLIMHDVYSQIPFDEEHKYNDDDYFTMCYTKLFNDTVRWIQYSILAAMDSKKRASMIKKWIKCGAYLLSMRNFHALVAVHCALTSNIVYRGKLTVAWSEYRTILKGKHHRKFRQIAQIVSYRNNYSVLRTATDAELAARATEPILPYWGIFKRDVQAATECKNGAQIICKLKQRYDRYKQGEYVHLKRNDTIRTWIHYQLHETSCIDQQAMNRMAENVREHDLQKWNERRRRYSLKSH